MQPLRKKVWKFLIKLKLELIYDPTVLLLGTYPEKTKALIRKDNGPKFIAALLTIAKIWKQLKCPITVDWFKKILCVYIYIHIYIYICIHTYNVGYYSAIKRNEIMSFATPWMDLEIIILSEVSQTKKDK